MSERERGMPAGSGDDRSGGSADRAREERELPPDHDHWLVRPSTIRLLWGVFIGVLAVTLVPDFTIHQHVHFGPEDFFGFYAWYGFGTCVLMVVGAKALGMLIKRGDDYYDG